MTMSRRMFLGAAAGVAASAITGTSTVRAWGSQLVEPGFAASAATATAGTGYLPYTADSFFKSKVAGAPIDATRTAAFRSFMKSFVDQKGTAYPTINGLSGSSWGTPFAIGTSSDPVWKLTGTLSSKVADLATTGFHAPDWLGSILTGTTDSPFCVLDMASGFTVFGGKASQTGTRTISVGSAGKTWHSSNGLHFKNPKSNDSRNFTSRGRISDSMVIRRDIVDKAIAGGTGLGHVLHLFLCETRSSDGYCSPMVSCEGNKAGWGAEGERIAIDQKVNLTTRGLSPFGLAIARTLQQHGAYIGDNAGKQSALKAEQASAARNPWSGLAVSQDALKGLTWDDFVVVPRGWQ